MKRWLQIRNRPGRKPGFITTPTPPTLLAAPTNVRAVSITTTSFTLTWDDVLGAVSFLVDIADAEFFRSAANNLDGPRTHRVTGLTGGSTIPNWGVIAVDVNGVRGERSDPIDVTLLPPVPNPNTALAFSRGPVSGFAQAADFYDSVGINHHPEYGNLADIDATIALVQSFGLRHVRMGMYSPADHGAFEFYTNSGTMGAHLATANAGRAGGVQPISVLWGTTEEPLYEQSRQDQNRAVYTIGTTPSTTNSTFTRPLDGPSGSVSATDGASWINGLAVRLENGGTYFNQGWITAGGLQGPNEPDNGRTTFWTGTGSVRDTLNRLKAAKNARSNTVLAGASYIDSTTGRIVAGPATANQLPVVGPHLTGNNWSNLGTASAVAADVDCGNRHTYWGGHGPNYTELQGQWAGSTSYTGLPRFCTETGCIVWGTDPGPGRERKVPPEVAGVYNNRSLVINYLQGVRRTYIYKLTNQESGGAGTPYGICDSSGAYTAAAHALKNLLTLVGFVEATNPASISVSVTGFSASADQTLSDGYVMPDRLDTVLLQRSATEYLLILVRQREIYDRGLQNYITANAKTVTLNLPANTVSAAVAEPEKNPIRDPVDSIIYANAGNGTAYQALTLNGSKQVTGFQVSGLTRIVKITTS